MRMSSVLTSRLVLGLDVYLREDRLL